MGSEVMLHAYSIFVGYERGIKLLCYSISIWSCCYTCNYTNICDEHGRVNSFRCFCGSLSLLLPVQKYGNRNIEGEKRQVAL